VRKTHGFEELKFGLCDAYFGQTYEGEPIKNKLDNKLFLIALNFLVILKSN
jgi:hypothetical protein